MAAETVGLYKMTIDEYLKRVGKHVDDEYGLAYRRNFADNLGTSQPGMLGCPTRAEYQQLKRAVAIMTSEEKRNIESLSDEQIERIADDAGVDRANFAIFINAYALKLRIKN
jgi:hypothetical protein